MQVGNAALVEAGGELVLGKAGAARRDHGAHVDQKLHAGLFEFVEHRFRRRLLIADGEEFFCSGHLEDPVYLTRSISSIAPAGARILPS